VPRSQSEALVGSMVWSTTVSSSEVRVSRSTWWRRRALKASIGVLLKACGTRRESRCPSCAATYRADAYQLLAAGLKGGKGVPETVAGHPRLFVTFTAPSFGRVHTARPKGGWSCPAIPTGRAPAAPTATGPAAGTATTRTTLGWGSRSAPACYDAQAQVLWNALAPELWRRTTIAVQRALARQIGLDEVGLRQVVRVSYAKVAEFQRRGAIHFHAVIRLDAATACRCPGCLAPPPQPFTAVLLEDALRQAVATVRVPCPPLDDGGPGRYARWGEQLDVRNITRDGEQAGELSAEQVAGYVAKYATAMIRLVVAVGSDSVRDRRDAWLWTCRPAVATVSVHRAVLARA
jgi:replication initiator protein RepSA